ncbi:GerAB/ArcD/ProY family transporter [Sporosalibacterium faouarense]|uniref:GerAB/ArcD/ProY family transporter n=1 Tax=Sporosalibacterium faouarense TaxID=516123 RepID=UPI00192BFDC2|nr:endospore germination permease [Sporosalibacterium faouarense]
MKDRKINIYQYRAILITATIGIGLITLPRALANKVSTASWLAMTLGTVILIVISFLILRLLNYFPNNNIYEISQTILGKYLSIIITLIFISYYTLVTSSTVRFTTDAINVWMLPLTPMSAIIFILLIVSSYVCLKGTETLGRFCTAFLFFNILSVLLVLFFTFTKVKPYNIQPYFHTTFVELLKGTKESLLSLLGIETFFVFHKFINNEQDVASSTYKSIIFIGILYVLLVEATIGYFGVDQIKTLVFPVISLFKTIEVRYFIFERIELFFLTLWLAAAFTTICIYYYCGFYLLKVLLPKKVSHAILPIYFAITFYLSRLPQNIDETFKLLNYTGNLGILICLIITVLLLSIGKIRGVFR